MDQIPLEAHALLDTCAQLTHPRLKYVLPDILQIQRLEHRVMCV